MTSGRPAPGAALSSPGTRAVLIGTGAHAAGSGLPDVPAVGTTLADLEQVLVSRCGMAEGNVRVLADPRSPLEVGLVLAESAKQAQDVLLVCYVGHGLVSPGGELYLATSSTERRPELLAYTALACTAVRDTLLESPARSLVVVLDCCFSGKAVGVLGALEGYVLTSAAREELALAPPGARHTAFTGELIRLLDCGDPDGPALLTLRHAYQYLNRVLPAGGFPKPHRRASGLIDDLVLAPNPAYHPFENAPPKQGPAGPELDECPYPGLAAFRTEDARWFFGRERVTTELVGRLAARLEQARPLVLVGVSGSGKSSLLRAGLLPALSEGTLLVPGSRAWPHLLFTPTTDPVGELATQVARLAGVAPHVVRAELVADPEGFAATVRRALAAWAGGGEINGARVVVVVDQFEETFLRCAEERDRQVFIRALCAAAGAGDGEPPALVVLGVRADLYGRCAAYPELLPALQDGQVVLGPMRSAELRAAIEGPAHAASLALEPGLVETLLRELSAGNGSAGTAAGTPAAPYDPGALPLLSHALHATWEHRADRTLTVAGSRPLAASTALSPPPPKPPSRDWTPPGSKPPAGCCCAWSRSATAYRTPACALTGPRSSRTPRTRPLPRPCSTPSPAPDWSQRTRTPPRSPMRPCSCLATAAGLDRRRPRRALRPPTAHRRGPEMGPRRPARLRPLPRHRPGRGPRLGPGTRPP